MGYVDFRRTVEQIVGYGAMRYRGARAVPISPGMLEVAFFASLATEERQPLRCTLVVLDPDRPAPDAIDDPTRPKWSSTSLGSRLPLTVSNLAKLAAAADPWSTAIAVYRHADGSEFIWGLVDQQVHYNRWKYLDAGPVAPGPETYRIAIEDAAQISVYWNFTPLARVIREQVLLAPHPVFRFGPVSQKISAVFDTLLAEVRDTVGVTTYDAASNWHARLRDQLPESIQRILLHMRKYNHGGALLIANGSADALRPKHAITYSRFRDTLARLGAALVEEDLLRRRVHWQEHITANNYWEHYGKEKAVRDATLELDGSIQFIASLARVDGLVWLDRALNLCGFGVEIKVESDPPDVFVARDADATADRRERVDPARYGMRHRSMMRYCYSDPEAVGFVISQDGPVRAIARADDSLLFWDDIAVHGF